MYQELFRDNGVHQTPLELMGFQEGYHFVVDVIDRGHPLTVIAPHGGDIEFGTSTLARGVAGEDFNLFDLRGILPEGNWQLHVTSTLFRHPKLSPLLKRSAVAASFHGFADTGELVIVGGLNHLGVKVVIDCLNSMGFYAFHADERYAGASPQNFVNLAQRGGIQLEVSLGLRNRLTKPPLTPEREERCILFCEAVREALQSIAGV